MELEIMVTNENGVTTFRGPPEYIGKMQNGKYLSFTRYYM